MWIDVSCVNARVTRATDEEREWLSEFLAFPDAQAFFRRGKRGDGKIRMFEAMTGTFPAGLVGIVAKEAPTVGFKVESADHTRAVPPDSAADIAWLREDQREGVRRSLDRRRGILWLPTGSGKTEIGVGLARSVPTHWLFIVHRTTLAEQAAERFDRRNAEHDVDLGAAGVIGEGRWVEGERLTCATFQSLVAALKRGGDAEKRATDLLQRSGGMIVDEAHVLPAETFWAVAMRARRAAYRIGLSGTPLARGDRRSVLAIAALGPVIYRIRADALVAEGILAKPKVRLVALEQLSNKPTYQGVYGELVVRSRTRNALLVEMAKRTDRPAFLFVKEVAHGKALENALLQAGIPARFVWGSHSTDYRSRAVRDLVAGRIEVLVCSVVFQEGVDVPALRSVVIGSGGRSVIAAIQRVGRGMRIERNRAGEVVKDEFAVWDVFDEGQAWLERAAKDRKRAYQREGYETIVEDGSPLTLSR